MDNPDRYTEQGPEFYGEAITAEAMTQRATEVLEQFLVKMSEPEVLASLKRLAAR